MLDEVGKRHGETRGRFSFSPSRLRIGGGTGRMTDTKDEIGTATESLAVAEALCRSTAIELHTLMEQVRAGKFGEMTNAFSAIRGLRAGVQLALEERGKLDKLRKQTGGVAYHYALDFDAARDEIARRLDRLGAARGG